MTKEFSEKVSDTLRKNDLVIQVLLAQMDKPKFQIGDLIEVTGTDSSWDGIRLRVLETEVRKDRSVLSMPTVWHCYKLGVRINDNDPNSDKFIFWVDEDCLKAT